jgi:hypothetical protein
VSDSGDQPNRMAEIAGLAASLADRILEKHEAGTSIPPELFRMLVQAARILHDNGVAWPPSVDFLVMEVGKRIEEAEAGQGDGGSRLTRALDGAKRPDA